MPRTSNSRRIGSRFWDVLLLVLLPGCPGSTPTVAPEATGASQPEPVTVVETSEPEPAEPVPAAIEVEKFAFLARDHSPFPRAAPIRKPHVLMSIDNPEGETAELAERLVASDDGYELHDDPSAVGLSSKPKVWMFGPAGPCEAKVGKAYVAAYDDPYLTLERGWVIEECVERPAPLVYVGPAAPSLRWREVDSVFFDEVEDPAKWEHATKPVLVANGLTEWEPDAVPGGVFIRVREAGKVWEIGYAHHWPHDEACAEEQAIDLRIGLWDGESFEEFPAVSRFAGSSELVGVLELDGEPVVVVADDHFQLQLGRVTGRKVTWKELRTGDYHDEDVAYWGWSVLDGYCGP